MVKATQSHYNLEAIQNLKDISSFTNKGNPVALILLDSLKYNFGSAYESRNNHGGGGARDETNETRNTYT
ncbi:hypothetical protein BGO18_04550 [Candidatus Saccharibacteria bacterium 47-87]|nr:MAG: hypothetical protein BGO18_04550 [Candidatus Saccharibacteria bacterium 47-87]